MHEAFSNLTGAIGRPEKIAPVFDEESRNLAFGAMLKLRFGRLKTWLRDKRRLSAAVAADKILQKALLAPIRQSAEGSRYRTGDCLFEYLADGQTRRYRICGIQNGGSANVYTAIELNSMQPFCLKVNRSTFGDPRLKDELLMKEALVSRRLAGHPNLVALYSVFRHRNRLCNVYEYVSGHSLDLHLHAKPLEVEKALRYGADLCRALAHADRRIPGFVHGDIKPANCLIAEDEVLKLADFGHAAEADAAAAHKKGEFSPARRFGGTYGYMAPELFGTQAVDRRPADVYAFGVTLYEMLAGKRPFDAESRSALVELQQRGDLRSPLERLAERGVPARIIRLIARCLDLDAAARPENFELILAEIEMTSAIRPVVSPPAPTDKVGDAEAVSRPSCLLIAKDCAARRAYAEAENRLAKILEHDPLNVPALNLAGAVFAARRRDRRAVAFYRQSLRVDAWQTEAYEGLCRLYEQRGSYRKAHRTALEAAAHDAENQYFHRLSGDYHCLEKNYGKAVASYKKAILLEPGDPLVRRSFLEAALHLSAEITSSGANLLAEGARLLGARDLDEESKRNFAAKVFELPLERDEPLAVLFALDDLLIAGLYQAPAEIRRAARRYLQAAEEKAGARRVDFDVFYAIGKIFYHLALFADCERVFRFALTRKGSRENAYYYLGACREIANDPQAALKFYQAARRLNRRCELTRAAICRVKNGIVR